MGAIPLNNKILSAPGSPIPGNSFNAPFTFRSLFSAGVFSSFINFSSAHFKSPPKSSFAIRVISFSRSARSFGNIPPAVHEQDHLVGVTWPNGGLLAVVSLKSVQDAGKPGPRSLHPRLRHAFHPRSPTSV